MGYRDAADAEIVESALKKNSPLESVAALLARSGVDPEEISKVSSVKISDWQQGYKDAEGEAHVLDLHGTSLVLHPSWEEGPQWPLIQPVDPINVVFRGRVRKIGSPESGKKRALILPDPQFGFMKSVTGELIPFHDPAAIAASVVFARSLKPDVIVILGDVFDLPVLSKYRTHPAYEGLMMESLQAGHAWLSALSGLADEIYFLEGNHDKRLHDYTIDYAKAVFGLKRAGDPPDSWPVLSIPYLVHLDELGIDYVPGYPVCRVQLAPNLVCIHGKKLKLEQVVNDERICVVQGHTHKSKLTYHQFRSIDRSEQRWIASPGALCRTDGAVPGVNHALDPRGHEPIDNPQDWHQGVAVVTYDPDGGSMPLYEHAPIQDGVLLFRDRSFEGVLDDE